MIQLNTLYNESNLDTMKRMGDNTIDSIVTDPPYEIGFMNKKWDNTGIAYSVEFWKECLRVLKPGGYLLSFSSSRTYHRMTCSIEDAGFEIRDMIEWVYGSGFPKSLNIGKVIDKQAGVEREVTGEVKTRHGGGKHSEKISQINPDYKETPITAPATPEAKQWEGWGTALKPAHESICMARKPLIGTVVDNVLQYGTGGINVDGCRVSHNEPEKTTNRSARTDDNVWSDKNCGIKKETNHIASAAMSGRFPANLIHDGSDEVVAMFPVTTSGKMHSGHNRHTDGSPNGIYGRFDEQHPLGETIGDSGSAARFFYCAKASQSERNMGCEGLEEKTAGALNFRNPSASGRSEDAPSVDAMGGITKPKANHHPTVKPIALMKYLVTLVTPPNGTVYDPFAGSGSTLCAAEQGGFKYIGSELQAEYVEIANARINSISATHISQLTLSL